MKCTTKCFQTTALNSKVYLVEIPKFQNLSSPKQRAANSGLSLKAAITPKLLSQMLPIFDTS
jgi:hypothetical protein